MKKYNVGIIGYGWAASAHIAAINATSHAQVTAVYSSRKLDDAELSAKHGGKIKTYTDLDEMLASRHPRGGHLLDARASTRSRPSRRRRRASTSSSRSRWP